MEKNQTTNIQDDGWNILFTTLEVETFLNKLDDSKATGSDGIPAKVLRLAADLLAPLLTHLFNCCTIHRKIPQIWKVADVCPIPKKNNPAVSDLRPISLLPICIKIYERLLGI